MTWEQIREVLKGLRADKGWTQATLAKAMNVSQSTVSDHEYGRTRPTLESLARWSGSLGVHILIALRNGEVRYSITLEGE